jgi:hypothetical protein
VPFLDANTGESLYQDSHASVPASPSALPVELLLKSLQAESPAGAESAQPGGLAPAPALPMVSPAAGPRK